MKKIKQNIQLVLFALLFTISSCGFNKYNEGVTEKTNDKNEGNKEVYGNVEEKESIYMKTDYTAPANAASRMKKIKEKMYGKEGGEVEMTSDSTATEEAPVEETPADTTATN